jgi:hypothetical protein
MASFTRQQIEKLVPGGSVTLTLSLRIRPGYAVTALEASELYPEPTGPDLRFPTFEKVDASPAPGDGDGFQTLQYAVTAALDGDVKPRSYKVRVTVRLLKERTRQRLSGSATIELPVHTRNFLGVQRHNQDDVEGSFREGATFPLLYENRSGYSVLITGIEVSDSTRLIVKTNRVLEIAELPVPALSSDAQEITIPGRSLASHAVFPALTAGLISRPRFHINRLRYRAFFPEGPSETPSPCDASLPLSPAPLDVEYRLTFDPTLVILSAVLGAVLGLVVRRRGDGKARNTKARGLVQRAGGTILLVIIFVILASAAQMELLTAGERRLLSYSNPGSALVAGFCLALFDPEEIIAWLKRHLPFKKEQGE